MPPTPHIDLAGATQAPWRDFRLALKKAKRDGLTFVVTRSTGINCGHTASIKEITPNRIIFFYPSLSQESDFTHFPTNTYYRGPDSLIVCYVYRHHTGWIKYTKKEPPNA